MVVIGGKKFRLTERSSRSLIETGIDNVLGKATEAAIVGTFNAVTGRGRSLWGGQVDRLRKNAGTVITGQRKDKKGRPIPAKDGGRHSGVRAGVNRARSAVSIPVNVAGMAVTAPFSATAAVTKGVTKGVAKGAIYGVKKSAKPIARFVGGATYESARVGGQILNGGLKTLRIPGFTDAAIGATFVGVTGYGLMMAMDEIGGGNRDFNGHASSLSGTTGAAVTPLVNTGANGDLVLAMHKLR